MASKAAETGLCWSCAWAACCPCCHRPWAATSSPTCPPPPPTRPCRTNCNCKPPGLSPGAQLPRTQEDVQALVADIRAQGYSRCQHTLLPHFTSPSVPIFDLSGSIIAALTVMGPSHLLDAESERRVLGLLKRYAGEISQVGGGWVEMIGRVSSPAKVCRAGPLPQFRTGTWPTR
ncbi:IclR family transcriptional regulator C-terminal domain-containing protein [Delftia sp. ASV31]|uniref:IclR family transcriptional regulator domain-containing protein n=1 Tax=Delftia sp. ASV31 TaxID=2795113 RepID=UPI0018EB52B0